MLVKRVQRGNTGPILGKPLKQNLLALPQRHLATAIWITHRLELATSGSRGILPHNAGPEHVGEAYIVAAEADCHEIRRRCDMIDLRNLPFAVSDYIIVASGSATRPVLEVCDGHGVRQTRCQIVYEFRISSRRPVALVCGTIGVHGRR